MEDAHAGELSGGPFLIVLAELGIDAFEEWPNEGDLERIAYEVALLSPVLYYNPTVNKSRRVSISLHIL